VRGKTGILFKVASAVTEAPDGVVREVIFPVVDERTFHALVKEAVAAGTTPARRVHTAVRGSYGSYYRRMMPKLLAALDFRSNNGAHRPIIEALERVRAAEGEGRQYFSCDEVPTRPSDQDRRPRRRDQNQDQDPSADRRSSDLAPGPRPTAAADQMITGAARPAFTPSRQPPAQSSQTAAHQRPTRHARTQP
jgi:hypothetical protein